MSTTGWASRLVARTLGATSREELLELGLEQAQRLLDAPIGFVLLTQTGDGDQLAARAGLRTVHFETFGTHWHKHDPTLRSALEHCTAMRDCDVTGQAARAAFRAGFCERIGAEAYLVAPLYGHSGGTTGTLHLFRKRTSPSFSDADRLQATAFAALLSMILARSAIAVPHGGKLAPREHQVALLAASGRTNRAIAVELGVAPETVKQTLRRVFRKVSVGSRTELAAHYARHGLLS